MIKQKPMRDLALGALMALGGAGLLSTVQAGTLTRVSSDETLFGGQVVTTALTPPGSVFYQKPLQSRLEPIASSSPYRPL